MKIVLDLDCLLSLWVFFGVWVIGFIAVSIVSLWTCQRWGFNLAMFFAAGLFYARYFTYLKLSSGSVVIAGLIAIVVAGAVVRYNQVQPSCGME